MDIKEIIQKRGEQEALLASLMADLDAMGVGLDGKLVDADGFPLANYDLGAIRELRAGARRAITDLKDLNRRIEQLLPEALARNVRIDAAPSPRQPFLKVQSVSPGTPAFAAGLVPGSLILAIDSKGQEFFRDLPTVLDYVQQKRLRGGPQHLTIQLLLSDQAMDLDIELLPGQSLGMHIVPIT